MSSGGNMVSSTERAVRFYNTLIMPILFRPAKWKNGTDYRITQWWGSDFLYKWKLYYKSMGFDGHMGIDYAWPKPWVLIPVYSAHDGLVVFAGYEEWWWNHIRIQHPDGFQTNYAHLSDISVKKGQKVDAMQKIGISGKTWSLTWPHLHFWFRPANYNYNNGFKGYANPTDFVTDWIDTDPTYTFWKGIEHHFENYSDTRPATMKDVKELIDIGLNKFFQKNNDENN